MGANNINRGGQVGIQQEQDADGDTTNVNEGGTVGIQGSTVSSNTVIIR